MDHLRKILKIRIFSYSVIKIRKVFPVECMHCNIFTIYNYNMITTIRFGMKYWLMPTGQIFRNFFAKFIRILNRMQIFAKFHANKFHIFFSYFLFILFLQKFFYFLANFFIKLFLLKNSKNCEKI